MRRILEKLARERISKEEEFARVAGEVRKKVSDSFPERFSARLREILARLEKHVGGRTSEPSIKKSFFKTGPAGSVPDGFLNQTALALKEIEELFEAHVRETRESLTSLLDLIEKQAALFDAKDREWDALGSNHVGMIFKSMEWRVEKLAAEYEDVQILMKKFLLLREKLDHLLSALEGQKAPEPQEVRSFLEPLEDWKYAGFENRFRGSEEEIRKQQAVYESLFRKGGKVLDLGCGRGEFLEILRERGIEGEGVDLNGQMIDICLDKGLNCRKGDILERLSEEKDGTVEGIFSSQVIEHLPPAYLKRLIETAYSKLLPGGTIILETVNPVSVFALVQIYYLDLSHQKPIHPRALQFMLESAGFRDIEIRYSAPLEKERLQELPGADEKASLLNQNIDRLNELLFAPPNYALIGKKR